ncbi:acyl-CoA dehydrogenase [Streptomyces sp. V4I2]|uniref:acyl-CoA dehydrogenase n=1 Tax=Streptomyces sp. V4I2 TaxID=3042280 RepID=UPI0027833642|nr:acyl-CoA dehydrogenase family protein [Streptomyces sp. V4I2]MDQ1044995.1 alkylation response protein AidB-like acyl-CoA dehydrogenase [Streptomyces sp. V4I2]
MTTALATTAGPARLHALESALGDPFADDNPLGLRAVLEADERGEMFEAGEQALHEYGLGAEFVPTAFGGRLDRLDHLVEIMRSVYRRDPCLGLGYGASSFIAGVNLWTAGDEEQCRHAAELLCSGRRVAVAYHELAHGNDMAGTEFTALPGPAGLVLNGRKEIITNVRRAEALVVFARTAQRPGSRSHSQLYVDKSRLPGGHLTHLPRYRTSGMRGVQLGGIEFRDCPLPESAVLGTMGHGLENALRSFPVTRTTLVSMFTGVVDSALRTTLSHVRGRRLYGRTAADLPHIRSVLAAAYSDLLTADCFATVATRALHLLPAQTPIYALAVKFFVSKTLMDVMNQLSAVLGAHFYLREGPAAGFQKLLRDIQPAGFGHAARAACQVSLLPQLPLLARRSWLGETGAPAELFRPGADLPAFDFRQLVISAAGRESLSTSLAAGLAAMPNGTGPAYTALRAHGEHFAGELVDLAEECVSLSPAELSVGAGSHTYDLTTRYVKILVAAACFETWRHARGTDAAFLADPAWAAAALHRLRTPLGTPRPSLPGHLEQPLWDELLDRCARSKGLGMLPRPLAGSHG